VSYADDVTFFALDILNASENGTEDDQAFAYARLLDSDVAIADVIGHVAGVIHEILQSTPDELAQEWRETLAERWEAARLVSSLDLPSPDDGEPGAGER
jgi:hypothetical protein